MLKIFFVWLDAHPGIFWWGGSVSVALLVVWLWRARRVDGEEAGCRAGDRSAVGLILTLLVAWRWPMLLETKNIGLMEAQLLGGALSMAGDPVPFRSVDLWASGPLAALALLPSHWLGIPQDYFNARLVALLLDWGTLATAYVFLRRFLPALRAMLTLLPVVLWFATSSRGAFHEYSPDHLGLWLTVLGGWLLWRSGRNDGHRWCAMADWIGAGLCLGLLPWVASGWAVIAVSLWLVAAVAAWREAPPGRSLRLRRTAQTGAFALYCTAAVFALMHGTGQWRHFWTSYVCGDFGHSGGNFLGAGWPPVLWIGIAAVAALGLVRVLGAHGRAARYILPALSLVGAGQLVVRVAQGPPQIFGRFSENWRHPDSLLGRQIRTLRQAGDSLAVWGCRPQLYVEAGLPQAVRSGVAIRELAESSRRDGFFRPRYLAEIERRKPVFFIDAVGPGAEVFQNRAQAGHEVFEGLGAAVQRGYRLIADDGQARLYVRFDRVAELDRRRPGAVRLTLSSMRVAQALAGAGERENDRISVHAPSLLTHGVPRDVRVLRGIFGFFEGAYADPAVATDGALFIVEVVAADGQRTRLLERKLSPASNPVDRGPIGFAVELPPVPAVEVDFIIDSGATKSCDWTYWGALQFDR